MINFITWNFDPVFFNIAGLEIRWYGFMFSISFLLGYLLLTWMLKKEKANPDLSTTLLWYVAAGVIVGARLGHCFFYEPAYYLAHPIEIFYIRDGGLASHGAAIAILTALWIAAKKYKVSYIYILDRVVVTVALSGFFIRMGNLFNSEIYGQLTDLPWGFIFERNGEVYPKHPTQIYEALSYLGVFVFLMLYYMKFKGKPKEGIMFSVFLIGIFAMRFLIEILKENQEAWEAAYCLNMGQILSIPFVVGGLVLLFYYLKRPKNA